MRKTCTTCRVEKPLSEFHKDRTQRDGLNHRCKPCFNAYRPTRGGHNSPSRGTIRRKGIKACKKHAECSNIQREEVLRRGDGICGICGRKVRKRWHMDHIIPVSKGGPHCYKNLQPSHVRCNLRKGNKIAL